MPLSPERIAQIKAHLAANEQRTAAPVVLSEQDQMTEDQKSKTILDMFVGEQPAPASSGMSPERMAQIKEYLASQANQGNSPEQNIVARIGDSSLGRAVGETFGETGNIIKNIPNQNPVSSGLQILGQGAKAVTTPIGMAISAVTPESVKNYVSDSAVGDVARQYAERWRQFSQSNPEMSKNVEAAVNIGSTLMGGKAATSATRPVADIAGSGLEKAGGALIKDVSSGGDYSSVPNSLRKFITTERSGGIDSAVANRAKVWSNDAKSAQYEKTYADLLDGVSELRKIDSLNYGNVHDIAAKLPPQPTAPIRGKLSMFAQEAADDVNTPSETRTFLNRIAKSVDDGEDLPVSDLVELEKFFNARYGKKRIGSQEARIEAQAAGFVKGKLDEIGAQNPVFGEARAVANRFFSEHRGRLQDSFFKDIGLDPQKVASDIADLQRVRAGKTSKLLPSFIKRAKELPTKINSDLAYREVAPLVSQENQKLFADQVLKHSNPKGSKSANSVSRLLRASAYGVGSMGGSPYMRARFAAELSGMVKGQDPLVHVVKRGVTPFRQQTVPDITKAQKMAEEISRYGQKALPYYPPQQQAPEILVGATGAARPATQGETMAQALIRAEMQRTGQYPMAGVGGENLAPARAAASAGESDFLRQYGTAKMLGNENMNIPQGVPPEPAGWRGNAALIQAEKAAAIQKAAQEQAMQDQIAKMSVVTADDAAASAVALRDLEAATGAARKNTAMEEKLLEALKKSSPTKTTITLKNKRK